MEENLKPSKQKHILKPSTPFKIIPTKKAIVDGQYKIPLSKSRTNFDNIYDDVGDMKEGTAHKPVRLSIKQIGIQNKENKISNNNQHHHEEMILKANGTQKRITFKNQQIQNEKEKVDQIIQENINEKNNNEVEKLREEVNDINTTIIKSVLTTFIKGKQIEGVNKDYKDNAKKMKYKEKTNEVANIVSKVVKIHFQKQQNELEKAKTQQQNSKFYSQKGQQQNSVKGPTEKQQDHQSIGDHLEDKQNESKMEHIESWSRKTCQTFRSTHSSCQDYLNHVFNYYCKITYPLSKNVTFEQIEQKMRMMMVTNFMIFCKDFKVKDHLDREVLLQIFKKTSTYQKYLTPEQFHTAIEKIADIMFKHHAVEKRFGKMLMFLQIHNSFAFVRKMNKLGCIFRLKNKRGIDVNIMPKYTFKLTPNNGKTQDHIQKQVKERQKERQMLKEQHIKWYKNNRKNKVEELYQSAMKKSKAKSAKKSWKRSQKENRYPSTVQLTNKHKYYNPCEVFSVRRDNSYEQLYHLKREKQSISNSYVEKLGSDRKGKQFSQYTSLPSIYRQHQLKLNKIIAQAKSSILMDERENKSFTKDSLCVSQIMADNQYKRQYGITHSQMNNRDSKNYIQESRTKLLPKILGEIQPSHLIIPKKPLHYHRKSKQINQAELTVQSEIRSINPSLTYSRVKTKEHLRATAKVDEQHTSEMIKLKEIIGIDEQNTDELLEKHFNNEQMHELILSLIESKVR